MNKLSYVLSIVICLCVLTIPSSVPANAAAKSPTMEELRDNIRYRATKLYSKDGEDKAVVEGYFVNLNTGYHIYDIADLNIKIYERKNNEKGDLILECSGSGGNLLKSLRIPVLGTCDYNFTTDNKKKLNLTADDIICTVTINDFKYGTCGGWEKCLFCNPYLLKAQYLSESISSSTYIDTSPSSSIDTAPSSSYTPSSSTSKPPSPTYTPSKPLPSLNTPKQKLCTFCYGTGQCSICNGSGINRHMDLTIGDIKCSECNRTGICSSCHGLGYKY